jgi:hypothetical protein
MSCLLPANIDFIFGKKQILSMKTMEVGGLSVQREEPQAASIRL